MDRQGRRRPGGIAAAATIAVEHRGALEYELMTRAHFTLDDLGGRLTWPALYSFISHLPPGALSEDRNLRAWYDGTATADLLANILDALHAIGGSKKRFPRPWQNNREKRHLGAGAIPASKFEEWWNRR